MSYFYTTPSPSQSIKFYKNQQYYNILPFQFLPYHYYLFMFSIFVLPYLRINKF